jgi:hypothetical protein
MTPLQYCEGEIYNTGGGQDFLLGGVLASEPVLLAAPGVGGDVPGCRAGDPRAAR